MKRKPILLIAILFANSLTAQMFSFEMVFEDAVGNTDTLILGYDVSATDTIDVFFGELNIVSEPLDSEFDVRISNGLTNAYYNTGPSWSSKKQILPLPCNPNYPTHVALIDIKSSNWPVTATWDSSLFTGFCNNGSVFTSVNPGGWWDTGSPSDLWRVILNSENSVTFTSNVPDSGIAEAYSYVNSAEDTLAVFFLAFGDSTLISTPTSNNEIELAGNLSIYPNPTSGEINIVLPKVLINAPQVLIQVIDFNGRIIKNIEINTFEKRIILNISDLSEGSYLLRIKDEESFWTGVIRKE